MKLNNIKEKDKKNIHPLIIIVNTLFIFSIILFFVYVFYYLIK